MKGRQGICTDSCVWCAAPVKRAVEEPELSAVRKLIQEEEARPRRPEDDGRISDTVMLWIYIGLLWLFSCIAFEDQVGALL